MPLLRTEAEKLSNNTLIQGLVREIIDRDAMFALMPFTQVNSKAYVYNREKTLAGGGWVDPNETLEESASDYSEHVAKLKILAGQVDVDKFLDETMGDTNDQAAIQVMQKAKGMSRQFQMQLANGNETATPKAFDGLPNLVDGSMSFVAGTNGAAVNFELLDQLKDMVKLGPDAIVMRQGTWRAIRGLLRAMGGNTATMIEIDNFGYPVPAYDGVPVLINDFLAKNETVGTNNDTCSIYAVRFNEVDGLHGLYGGGEAGMRFEEIGTVQGKDAWRFRLKWYTTVVLKSTQSLARLQGVTNV